MNKKMTKTGLVIEVSMKIIFGILVTCLITTLYYYSWIILYP